MLVAVLPLRLDHALGMVCGNIDPLKTKANNLATDFWNDFGKRAPTYGPFTSPAYSDVTYDVLGLVTERLSQQNYGDYIQEKNPVSRSTGHAHSSPSQKMIASASSLMNQTGGAHPMDFYKRKPYHENLFFPRR